MTRAGWSIAAMSAALFACGSSGTQSGVDMAMSSTGSFDLGCASATSAAQLVPVSLVVMLDRSGSMGDGVNGDAALKWNPVTAGLKAFFADAGSAGVRASLQYFPLVADQCNPSGYYFASVGMRALPDATSFAMSIDATSPGGNTPTRPAILGAIDLARDTADANPSETVAIVLVTDGEPDICDSSVNNVSLEANKVAGRTPTYVIGVGPASASLDMIANSGGTGQATFVSVGDPAQTTADFLSALDAIRGKAVSCDFPLPPPPTGMALDFTQVNVLYTGSQAAPQQLLYDRSCASGTGWRYDNENSPTRVELCADTCVAAKQDRGAKIEVVFGCTTAGDLIL